MKENNIHRTYLLFLGVLSCAFLGTFAQEQPALKDVFENYFFIGAALNTQQILGEDTVSSAIIGTQFNSITSENVLKWERIHPRLEEYDFELADRFVEVGEKKNMFIIGHTLVWHSQTPRWVFEDSSGEQVSREILLNRMRDHINTVVGRYKGRIKGWDVVNEALNEDGTLRNTQWMKIIGEDYLEKAFEFAHDADPDAELYYNDFSLENEPKRNGAIKLIKKLQSKGINIFGVGLQGHYKMDWPTPTQLDSTIKAFAELGIKVMITELDVDVLPYRWQNQGADIRFNIEMQEKLNPYKGGLPDSVQLSLAERYKDLFNVFVDNKEIVTRVTFWGVTDGDSWLNYWPVRGRTNYPLLFDRSGKPKPAYMAIIKIVQNKI
jgi:endo-1,4-beta-xylanase